MAELKIFRLPDVGEGLTEADIVKWHVQPGDSITINQVIVEIETAKAVVELPSPYAGVVADLLVPEGQTADVGTGIISVQVGQGSLPASPAGSAPAGSPPAGSAPAGSAPAGPANGAPRPEALVPPAAVGDLTLITTEPEEGGTEPGMYGTLAPKPERQAVLVGYGVKLGATKRRPRKSTDTTASAAVSPAGAPAAVTPAAVTPAAVTPAAAPSPAARPAVSSGTGPARVSAATTAVTTTPSAGTHAGVLAKPPVRKLAKDLGVDLAAVTGTGEAGQITRDDVQAAAAGGAERAPAPSTAPVSALIREERIPIKGVRKHMAAAMVASAFSAPHVTEFLQIDITETMTATARLKRLPDFEDVRVSPLLLVAKALLIATARHPMINSSWDEAAQEIVVRHYVNLGIAAATDRGLVVPTVKDAHALSLPVLGQKISELTETARAGRATPADLSGGTITITNVGVFGVDTGTPIITPPEAAILAFGQVKDAPWVVDGELAVRKVCTLALSFDHRIIDGATGSAVLREVGDMLTDPLRMLAWS
jgi:pyruvate dehydrogenase E2 component (dihydrolipoamide acetyltransferase)